MSSCTQSMSSVKQGNLLLTISDISFPLLLRTMVGEPVIVRLGESQHQALAQLHRSDTRAETRVRYVVKVC